MATTTTTWTHRKTTNGTDIHDYNETVNGCTIVRLRSTNWDDSFNVFQDSKHLGSRASLASAKKLAAKA